ncbi:glycosyltransferase family 4 protein [Limnoglobus roseus]|uniref:GT4 family glycosyltransferase n=1 Tax=Limnoglobus roseus TaxID=2598579 RepID=A0A5C1A3S6_9BACT|nr:glycosyltransferase family 4 protein [Limnoglobus roseus]QEL13250.1 GT4 family glycosyltransferase [Limnoglobus roseus]
MRVLIVSHLALPHVGGVENLVDLEIRALANAGHAVTLVTSDGDGRGAEPNYPTGVTVIRVPASHVLERRFGIPYPLFSPRLVSILWRELGRADVVHAHGFLFLGSIVAMILAKWRSVPSVLTDHGGVQKFASPIATLLARVGVETLGRVTTMLATRAVAYNSRVQLLLAKFRRRSDVAFVMNPVDGERFFPPTQDQRAEARRSLGWDDRPKVLFVGRLLETKGVPLLLAASDTRFDLVFCGPGDVSMLGPLPRTGVVYLPPRPQAELRTLYHAADVLVLPAEVREGFPLVVQEALSCGLPVVLGYDPGFEPYGDLPGLVFTERTVEAVRIAIREALAPSEPRRAGGVSPLILSGTPSGSDGVERPFPHPVASARGSNIASESGGLRPPLAFPSLDEWVRQLFPEVPSP